MDLMESRNHKESEIAKGLLLGRLRKWYKKSVSVSHEGITMLCPV